MNLIVEKLKKDQVFFMKHLPSVKKLYSSYNICLHSSLIICDRKLTPLLKSWSHKSLVYFVKGGEELKNMSCFEKHARNILKKISLSKTNISCFIGIGGGSVGDFTGFFSSIYKRGRPIFHFPTTLLSAVDSSHGGKTAMNFDSIKNVFGNYHFPQAVLIIKDFIQNQNKQVLFSANGEILKVALIKNKKLYKQLKKKENLSFENTWLQIPECIKSKLEITSKDPYEKKNIRKLLNLGHSLGHCIELYYNIPHGIAVAHGIEFAVLWSLEKNFLNKVEGEEIINVLKHHTNISNSYFIPKNAFEKLIREDKKRWKKDYIEFIFLKGVGNPYIQNVPIKSLVQFYQSIKRKKVI